MIVATIWNPDRISDKVSEKNEENSLSLLYRNKITNNQMIPGPIRIAKLIVFFGPVFFDGNVSPFCHH